MATFIKTAGRDATNPDKFFWAIRITSDGKPILEKRDIGSAEEAVADLAKTIEELAKTDVVTMF